MRTIEFESHTNSLGNLEINYPIQEKNKNVRVVVFIDEEIIPNEKKNTGFERNLWGQFPIPNPQNQIPKI